MAVYETVSFRVTPVLLAQIDTSAGKRGMTRSDWMRNALIEVLRDELRQDGFAVMEQQLFARIDDLQTKLIAHITREIDSLTSN